MWVIRGMWISLSFPQPWRRWEWRSPPLRWLVCMRNMLKILQEGQTSTNRPWNYALINEALMFKILFRKCAHILLLTCWPPDDVWKTPRILWFPPRLRPRRPWRERTHGCGRKSSRPCPRRTVEASVLLQISFEMHKSTIRMKCIQTSCSMNWIMWGPEWVMENIAICSPLWSGSLMVMWMSMTLLGSTTSAQWNVGTTTSGWH